MECDHCFPSQPFVVLTVDQFVGHDGGPLELEKLGGIVLNNLLYSHTDAAPQFL